MVVLPAIVYYLYFCVAFNRGGIVPGPQADWQGFFSAIVPTAGAAAVYLAWLLFQVVLFVFLPGRTVLGLPLEDGSRLRYGLNGLAALISSAVLLAIAQALGVFSLSWIHDNFGALLSVMTIFSFVFSVFVHYWGRAHPDRGVRPSRSFLADYFLGTALNPRLPPVSGFDLKFFFESRPGLIGWLVIDAAFAVAQVQHHGRLSVSMALVVGLQFIYIASYFVSEQGVLSMIDIRTESFGWMLVYGDSVLVPMVYSLQAFYLIDHVPTLPPWLAALILVLFAGGLYIFRSANAQKHRFRSDPAHCRIWGKPAEYIVTSRGTPLLVSGFWGLARHMNYLGDWLIAVSWSLPALFGSVVPYFYPLWMTVLLLNRERRDDKWCEKKYGSDWKRYCERVPSRILPGLY